MKVEVEGRTLRESRTRSVGKALVQNPALRAGFCGTRLAGVNGRWVIQQ